MSHLASKPVAFLDTETSGLDASRHEIVEFAAIVRHPDGTVTRTEFKIHPEHPETAEPSAWAINGYTPEGWVGALSQKEGAARMLATLAGCILVGHNVSFDVDFIKATLSRQIGAGAAARLGYHKVDTVTLAYVALAPQGLERLNLDAVCTFLGVTNEGAHRAMADVERCMACYDKLVRAWAPPSATNG